MVRKIGNVELSLRTASKERASYQMPFKKFMNRVEFGLALPKTTSLRLGCIISALAQYKAIRPDALVARGNHILEELQDLFKSDSGGIKTINEAIDYALNMIEGEKEERWAGLAALSVIPISEKLRPRLLKIGEVLANSISSDWDNVEAASHAAFALRSVLPGESKLSIISAAENALSYFKTAREESDPESVNACLDAVLINLRNIIDTF